MKHCPLWLLVTALMIAGCHSPTNPRDLLGIAYIGGIDKKSHQFAPAAGIDSAYAALVTKIAADILNKSLDQKISKNAEGYIKADLSRLLPDHK